MAALFRRPTISGTLTTPAARSFTTTTPLSVSLQWDKNPPSALQDQLPPYPYGPARWYKQSRLGLYGGQRIQFGNNVGEKIAVKTRRTWHPNIFTRKLFSKSLNRTVQVRVSARVLRTIDKLGGLDEYLLGEKEARIKELGESGWWLRWAVMQTNAVRKRFQRERVALGLEKEDTIAEGFEMMEASADEVADMEAVQMGDDAFQVVADGEGNAKDLPVIKFRVGPGKHVVLTAEGWRRARPDPQRWVDQKKARITERYADYVENRLAKYMAELSQKTREMGIEELSEGETKTLVRVARRKFRAELDTKVEEAYQKEKAKKERRQAERDSMKKVERSRKKGEEEEFPVGLEI